MPSDRSPSRTVVWVARIVGAAVLAGVVLAAWSAGPGSDVGGNPWLVAAPVGAAIVAVHLVVMRRIGAAPRERIVVEAYVVVLLAAAFALVLLALTFRSL